LGLAGLTAFAPILSGCRGGTATDSVKTELGPYSVWREVQASLKQSPDHTVGRAAILTEKGDPTSLLSFVKDEIRLVSGEGRRFAMGRSTLWGPRAALRCGAGTAREKAEILAELLRSTGREAEVVETTEIPRESVPAAFFRSFGASFAPVFTPTQSSEWKERLGDSADDRVLHRVEYDGSAASDLTASIVKAFPEKELSNVARLRFDDRQVGRTPVVKVTEKDGSVVYADPIRPEGAYGPLPDGIKEYPAQEIPETDKVKVTLSATTTQEPDSPFELVSGEWPSEVLCGRQLRVGFQPTMGFGAMLHSRFADVRTFMPALKIQALDLEEDLPDGLVVGTSFNLGGERLQVEEDGEVLLDGRPLIAPGALTSADSVSSVEIKADAGRFPEVRLLLTPRDSQQEVVEGLPASAFEISEGEKRVGCTLLTNRPAPRVLFLADQSLSMPDEFRGGRPGMEALVERVRGFAKEIHPDAEIIYTPTGSALWEELVKGSALSVNLIVFATDGDLDGREPDEAMLEVMRQGPPAMILDVNNRLTKWREGKKENIFDRMAELTGGEAFPVKNGSVEEAEQAIQRVLRERASAHPYLLSYTAPSLEKGTHTVRVAVGKGSAQATYEVSDSTKVLPRRIASLRLSVSVGKRTVTRVLAGHDGFQEIEQRDLDEVQGALFGTHILAFEGSSPSLSVLFDELLAAKIGWERLDKKLEENADLPALEAELAKGVPFFPGELLSLLQKTGPLSEDDFSFAPQGLRTVLYSVHPVMDSDLYKQRVDILPLQQGYVLARDQESSRRKAMELSLPLALAEASLFSKSTVAELSGKSLTAIDRRPFRKSELEKEQIARWGYLIENLREQYSHPGALYLGPEDGSSLALWAVDRATGEVLGILDDGSGGGEEAARIEAQIKQLEQVVAGLNILATAAGMSGAVGTLGGFSLGVVAVYGQQLARLYGAASMAVILMDPSGIEPAVRQMIAKMSCEVAKSIKLTVFASAGRVAAEAVNLFGTVENIDSITNFSKGRNPFACN